MDKISWVDYLQTIASSQSKITVGINDFVKRQTKPDFVGTKISVPELESLRAKAEQAMNSGEFKKGYADYVSVVGTIDPKILSSIAVITPENKHLLKTEITKRREGEDEFNHVYFLSKDVKGLPSHHVDLILYTAEQLEKEKEKHTNADYDLISVNAEMGTKAVPISPETMKRNIKGPDSGGSGFQHTKQEISQSEKFWENHAFIR